MNKGEYKKQGNVFISLGIIVLVIIFVAIFFVYYQTNIIIQSVRQDLFYASNNAILSFDLRDLSYRKYTVSEENTKQVIEYLLYKNYTQEEGSITKIKVTNLKIITAQDKVVLDVEVEVTFKSVINLSGKNEHKFKMKDSIKLSLLEYKIGE